MSSQGPFLECRYLWVGDRHVKSFIIVKFLSSAKQRERILTNFLIGGSDEYEKGVNDVGGMSDDGTGQCHAGKQRGL